MKAIYLILIIIFSIGVGYWIGIPKRESILQPKLILPEEFMCAVSDDSNKPDTILVYQSVSNDTLYLKNLNH